MFDWPSRKSIRLKEYDYANPGYYFITICTYKKEHFLGKIVGGSPSHSEAGEIVSNSLSLLPRFFKTIYIDTSMVMPNHVHSIIRLHEGNKIPLTQIIRNFKSVSARKIKARTSISKVWQRSFFDRIIRTDRELNLVRL